MKEVSCQVFEMFLNDLRKRKQPAELLIEGTGLSLALLQNKRERIDWADLQAVMGNVNKIWSDEDIIQLGLDALKRVRWFTVIARLLFTSRDIYRWMSTDGKGPGAEMFSNIHPRATEHGPGRITIELSVEEGYTPCREAFLMAKGSFIGFPVLLGHQPAKVTMLETDRGARYE